MGGGTVKLYNILWGLWAVGLFVQAFVQDVTLAVCLLVYFALLEGYTIWDSRKGDTWSEFNWRFYGDRVARIPLIVGFAVFTVAVFANIYFQSATLAGVGVGVLAAGVTGWLVPHMVGRGRWG
jgi:hypothetical protein